MVTILETDMSNFGRPPKVGRADQLLMTLMYWREYRTQFHIAQAYGISEATVCRTVRKIEDVLMQSGQFRLPGKKALQPSDTVIEIVVVDATEQAIERQQDFQSARRSGHPSGAADSRQIPRSDGHSAFE